MAWRGEGTAGQRPDHEVRFSVVDELNRAHGLRFALIERAEGAWLLHRPSGRIVGRDRRRGAAGEAVAGPEVLAYCAAFSSFDILRWMHRNLPDSVPDVLRGLHRLAADLDPRVS